MNKILLLLVLLSCLGGCFHKSENKNEPVTDEQLSALTTYFVVLEGYKGGKERREFQEMLEKYVSEVKVLNSGGNHAEYMVTVQPDQTHWYQPLVDSFKDVYTFSQPASDRLLFTRK